MGNGLATYYKTETRSNAYNTTDRLHTGKEFHAFGGLSWTHYSNYRDNLFELNIPNPQGLSDYKFHISTILVKFRIMVKRMCIIFCIPILLSLACTDKPIMNEVKCKSVHERVLDNERVASDPILSRMKDGFFCDTLTIQDGGNSIKSWDSIARIMFTDKERVAPTLTSDSSQTADYATIKMIVQNNFSRKINAITNSLTILKPRSDGVIVIKEIFQDQQDAGPVSVDMFGNKKYIHNIFNPSTSTYGSITDLSLEDKAYYDWDKKEIEKMIMDRGNICGGSHSCGYNIKREGKKAIIRFYVESEVLKSIEIKRQKNAVILL